MSWIYRRPADYRAKPSNLFALLAVASATSGTAAVSIAATGTMTGSGAMAGSASITSDASATPLGSTLAGTIGITASAVAAPTALGQMTGSADWAFANSGVLAGDVAYQLNIRHRPVRRLVLQPWYSHQQDKLVIFPYSQAAGIGGQSDLAFTPTGTLRATGKLIGALAQTLGATGSLTAAGALAGTAAITITPTGDCADGASGAVTGVSALAFTASATALAEGALSGVAAAVFDAVIATGSITQISGESVMLLSVSGTIRGLTIGAVTRTPRSRTVHVRNRSRR